MLITSRLLAICLFSTLIAAGCQTNNPATVPASPTSSAARDSGTATAATAPSLLQPAAAPAASSGEPELVHPRVAGGRFGAEHYRIVSTPDKIVSVLGNGAVVIVKRVPSPAVCVRGYDFTGGVYEGKWLGGGLSHLLEHLVAGGSSQRRTEEQNKDLLQKIGNDSNAYTSDDHTEFFINTTPQHMEQAVDLVTGWMLGALITPAEYRREYQVVQRELEMGKGSPDRQFWYLELMNRYRISPARVPVIGYQAVIQGLSRDDVYSYYKEAYVPNNMIFVVAGDMDPETMLAAVRKNVDDAPPGREFSHNIAKEPELVSPRILVGTYPKMEQAKAMVGYPSVQMDDPDMYAMDLLSVIFGGGESAMLQEQIRDKQGLVSTIEANDETPSYDTGTFGVEFDCDPDQVPQVAQAVLAMLDSAKEKPMDPERISRAKSQVRADRVRMMQKTEDIAESLGEDYLMSGDANFSDHYVDHIEAVTAADLQRVAKKYFDRNKLLTTVLFPSDWPGAKGLPSAESLMRQAATSASTTQPSTQPASVVEKSVLDDGTILLVKRMQSPVVVMNMYAEGGVLDEDAKTNGLGNLTMQMLMRGTKTRSAEDIADFFDASGGQMECGCGNNTFFWTATVLKSDFAKAFAVYADVINHPAFSDDELKEMKQRVAGQIQGQDAEWTSQASRYFKQQYYGPLNSPYQFVPIGTEANVKGFTADQIRDWYSKKVLPGKRVLAIFGDVDLAHAEQLANDVIGKSRPPVPNRHDGGQNVLYPDSSDSTPTTAPAYPPASIDVRNVKVQKTEQPLAGVVIGFDAHPYMNDPDQYTLDMVQTVTGGWAYPTGYLFETLRGRGLVYVVESQNSPGRSKDSPGTFLVFAGCDPKNVNEVVDLCLQNIARVQGSAKDINVNWFGRAKELVTVADALEHETPSDQAATAALDELYGMGFQFHDKFDAGIESVRLSQVQSVARARLRSCLVTISTPAPELVTVKSGVRTYDSFPEVQLTPRGTQHSMGADIGK
jgi:zinc protease